MKRALTPAAPRKRAKKPKLPPSPTAWACTILAVDPGERSGWAIWRDGRPLLWSECCDVFTGGADDGVAHLLRFPGPHIVVVERPFRTRFGTQVAVGAGDLIWRRAAERAGLGRRIVRVYPATWRARVLGKGFASAKRDLVRVEERRVATAITGGMFALGADESPALCIGKWASYAGEVGAKLPRLRKGKAA